MIKLKEFHFKSNFFKNGIDLKFDESGKDSIMLFGGIGSGKSVFSKSLFNIAKIIDYKYSEHTINIETVNEEFSYIWDICDGDDIYTVEYKYVYAIPGLVLIYEELIVNGSTMFISKVEVDEYTHNITKDINGYDEFAKFVYNRNCTDESELGFLVKYAPPNNIIQNIYEFIKGITLYLPHAYTCNDDLPPYTNRFYKSNINNVKNFCKWLKSNTGVELDIGLKSGRNGISMCLNINNNFIPFEEGVVPDSIKYLARLFCLIETAHNHSIIILDDYRSKLDKDLADKILSEIRKNSTGIVIATRLYDKNDNSNVCNKHIRL